eukprot:gene7164-11477_t
MNTFEYSAPIPVMEPKVCVEPTNMNFAFRPYKISKNYNFQHIPLMQTTPVQKPAPFNVNYSKIVENTFGVAPTSPVQIHHHHQAPQNNYFKETKGSSQTSTNLNRGEWNKEEHDLFMKGYKKYEKNWAMIAKEFVKTRTRQQVRNHAVKFFIKEEKAGRKLQF